MVLAGRQKLAFSFCSMAGTLVMKYFSLSEAVIVMVPSCTFSRKQSRMGKEFLLLSTRLMEVRRLKSAALDTFSFIRTYDLICLLQNVRCRYDSS